jgi:hypothetical protein
MKMTCKTLVETAILDSSFRTETIGLGIQEIEISAFEILNSSLFLQLYTHVWVDESGNEVEITDSINLKVKYKTVCE